MVKPILKLGISAFVGLFCLTVTDAEAGRRVNERPSDRAMEALRLDFMRDGVKTAEAKIIALYNEACQTGYRPACGWQAWHGEEGTSLSAAGEVFAPLCGPRDALACVVQGWVYEDAGRGMGDQKEQMRQYVLAAKHFKIACDTSGLKGIAGCYELAQMRAKGKGMQISTQAAYELHEWTCNAGYALSCVGLARLMPQELDWTTNRKDQKVLKRGTSGELYQRACTAGVNEGCHRLGLLQQANWAIDEQRSWFSGLCEQGFHQSCLTLADTFTAATPADMKSRVDAIEKGCDLGGGEACHRLAQGNEGGEFGAANVSAAGAAYQKGCDLGYPQSCSSLGRLIANGRYGSDRTAAASYLQSGCDGGVMLACVTLGGLYLQGEWVEKDSVQALRLLKPGCVDGEFVHPEACRGIASLYSEGSGVTRNRVEAARYLGISCEMGDLESCFLQGEQFSGFRGDDRYDDVALMAYEKACKGGLAEACAAGGRILEQGALKLRDDTAAAEMYETGCAAGLGDSCLALGSLLERGGGVSANYEAARSAFMRGMEAGQVEAQRRYARMLWHGLGGKKQRSRARKIYQDACVKGHSKACAGWRL